VLLTPFGGRIDQPGQSDATRQPGVGACGTQGKRSRRSSDAIHPPRPPSHQPAAPLTGLNRAALDAEHVGLSGIPCRTWAHGSIPHFRPFSPGVRRGGWPYGRETCRQGYSRARGEFPMPTDLKTGDGDTAALPKGATRLKFTGYQKFVVALLAFLQFSIILDFMIISPLGAIIMPDLEIGPQRFGEIVSAYAFSAGISGLLAAGFADRFDRKRFLLFFYLGFIVGTALCALAPNYPMLLLARIVTGVFGGVIGSVVLAIATDLFPLQMRGRVMGVVQTAFSASQALGIPAGLYIANLWNWHVTFLAIVLIAIPVGLIGTVLVPRYVMAFATTALLVTGGYMLMPFGSVYTVNNLGIRLSDLPTVYLLSGAFTIFTGPLVGRASDAFGKFRTFVFGCASTRIWAACR
jgi:MFS transporter